MLEIGQIIDNKYVVERKVGSGYFTEIYRVNHKFLECQVLKLFTCHDISQETVENYLDEFAILSRISHPHITQIFDTGSLNINCKEYAYYTMEYVPGGNLESFRVRYNNMAVPVDVTVNIIEKICEGLKVAHNQDTPIIHGNIKPQNIMMGYDENGFIIKISDFGHKGVIPSGDRIPIFKPPECWLEGTDSLAGDVWAVGNIIYLLLTDRLPFPIESIIDLFSGGCWKKELDLPSNFNPDVDEKLDAIVLKALEIDRSKRYKDAREMLNDLNRLNY